MTEVLPVLPVCLGGPLSPHLSQRKTGRRELRLLSVSSDGTLSVYQKADCSRFLLLLSSPFHSPSPPPLPLLRRHNSHVSGALGSDSPYVCTPPLMQIPLPHLQRAGQASSCCISLNGLKIFSVASHKETRFNAPTAFPLFLLPRGKFKQHKM